MIQKISTLHKALWVFDFNFKQCSPTVVLGEGRLWDDGSDDGYAVRVGGE